MIRNYWRDPHFWTWWWRQRVPAEAKIVAAVVAVSLLGFGGYAAAGGLDTAVTSSTGPLEAQVTTVERIVTIRERGQVVTKPVAVVRTVPGAGRTSVATATQVLLNEVTTPGRTYVVVQKETVPVVRQVVVTRDGQIRTVVQTLPGRTRTSVVTDQRTVTSERVVTDERVVTRDRVVTTAIPVTVRSTETVERTQTVPVTVVRIETRTTTVVNTLPIPVLLTITVTVTEDD